MGSALKRRDGIRAFVALGMPEPIQDALERLQESLPASRLVAPETLHLTLAFLDTQPEQVVAEVNEALQGIQADPITLTLRGVDMISAGRRGIVWVCAVPDPALTTLRNRIRRSVTDVGVNLDRERFRPHVTLARIGARSDSYVRSGVADFLIDHSTFCLEPFTISSFQLYRSTLHETGAVYDMLAEYSLGN